MQDPENISKGLQAGTVFTPTSPVDERSLFAGRTDQMDTIIDVIIQKGQHAILYGERGVGKTSLVNVLSDFLELPNISVIAPRVNCDSADTFASAWTKALNAVQIIRSKPGLGFNAEQKKELATATEYLEKNPSTDAVLQALRILSKKGLCIFIFDEFDRLKKEPRHTFSDTIKALSDYAIEVTVILVGVADSVSQLISEHQSVERALVQIQMPRMSSKEIMQILDIGVKRLEMTITPEARTRIGKLAQGLPHYAHLLGLYAARTAIDENNSKIGIKEVKSAITRAISAANQSIKEGYEQAVRSARKDNLFEDVLLSCALAKASDLGYFAAQDVRAPMKMITGRDYEIPNFSRHLAEFCDTKRGAILQKSGTKRLYRYRFSNPLMQPFVLMRGFEKERIPQSFF